MDEEARNTVKHEPIFEISTGQGGRRDPFPVAGTLLEIKVAEGQTVAINTVGLIGEAAEQPSASASACATPAPLPAGPGPPLPPPRPNRW
jgi:2-oxoglutarate dehydrogenase E2 component (dihydrolipoamide succinyltransferase)